jgi:hypothetical protein
MDRYCQARSKHQGQHLVYRRRKSYVVGGRLGDWLLTTTWWPFDCQIGTLDFMWQAHTLGTRERQTRVNHQLQDTCGIVSSSP